MRVVLYVFSGTGNTLLVANLYKKHFAPSLVTVHSIGTDAPVPDPNQYDMVGLGYPIHGFNAPQLFVRFCRALPQVQQKPAFIFKSSGEGLTLNDYSSQKLIRILEHKGFSFRTERHYVMPYNMIFRHTPQMVKSEYLYADALVRLNVRELLDGRKENVHTNPLKGWFVPFVRIEWLYARAQGPFMRVDMTKCVRCMKCVRDCPLHNISFDAGKDRFRFGTNCALCVRCSFSCPSCAISIGLLNGWRVNGSYRIEQVARDPSVPFPYFGEELRGLHRWLYYRYYRRLDAALSQAGIALSVTGQPE